MTLVKNAPHADLTYRISGAAMAVHNDLGPGHREEVYHNALAARFSQEGLGFQDEVPLPVETEGGTVVLVYSADFVVEGMVVTEIKAHSHPLTKDDMARVIDYLAATRYEVALLINFGRPRLEFKRLFPPKKIQKHRRKKWGKPM